MAGGTHGRIEATPSRMQIMMREPCAQTVVCAASRPAQQKQHATRRTKLLPNDMQKQQTNAASAKLLGYARVSKAEDQDTAPQIEALEAAGCTRVYEEHASGGRWARSDPHQLQIRRTSCKDKVCQ